MHQRPDARALPGAVRPPSRRPLRPRPRDRRLMSATSKPRRNIAASAGRWSARHRKTAVFGWILFCLIAFVAGKSAGLDTIKSTETGVGESGRADKIVGESWP